MFFGLGIYALGTSFIMRSLGMDALVTPSALETH